MLSRNSNLFTAIIVGVVGILMIVLHKRIELLNWISIAVGLMFVLPSLYVLCTSLGSKQKLPGGIAFVSIGGVILGLLMCIFPSAFSGLFVYVFAALLAAFGIYQIVDLASWNKVVRLPLYFYIVPILMIAAGIVILCTNIRDINTVVVLITGISLIAFSVNSIYEYLSTRSASQKVEERNGSAGF